MGKGKSSRASRTARSNRRAAAYQARLRRVVILVNDSETIDTINRLVTYTDNTSNSQTPTQPNVPVQPNPSVDCTTEEQDDDVLDVLGDCSDLE